MTLEVRTDLVHNPYGYVPKEWIPILFVVLFSISATIHAAQALHTPLWWLFPTVCTAGILEIIGWSARLWSRSNPYAKTPYLMQIVSTIIGPTPLVAANFIMLSEIIRRLGQQYSRLSAKWYSIIFVSCDMIALVVQAVGGATASTATNNDKNPATGGHIMLGGIVFQMLSITIYMALASEFILRYLHDRPLRATYQPVKLHFIDMKVTLMISGLTLSSVLIYIRPVYRTIELAGGWKGRIIQTERYFDWLDGGMIVLAMFVVNVFHPGLLLEERVGSEVCRGSGRAERMINDRRTV